MSRTRATGVALLALATLGALGACTSDDDAAPASLAEQQASASPSPSPSLDDEKQETIDAAQVVLDDYRQLEFDVAHDGYGGWARLAREYWGADLAETQATTYRSWADEGRYSTGEATVVSSQATDYVARDAGYEQVEFTVCLDRSELRQFEKDGTEVPWPEGSPRQYATVYRLAHSGPDGRWQVQEARSESDEEC